MFYKFYLLSSYIGLSLCSTLTQAEISDSSQTLATITLQAEKNTDDVQTSVAATKFSHDIIDVPFSRSFLSQEILKQQDTQRVADAIHLVSGVFVQNNYGGGFWDNYSFRGFASDPNLGAASIRNGLSLNRGLSAARDLVNIEALDFLKGPAAALYGRGEMGGLLNIITKKPQWETQSELNLRAETEQKYRASFEHTAPINDQIAYRFAIAHENNQSFRDHVSSERWFFSPQFTWKISEQTQLDFDSEITQHQGTFDRGISAKHNQILMNSQTFTGEPDDGDMHMNDRFYQFRLAHELNDHWKLNSAISYKQGSMDGLSTEPKSFASDSAILNRQRRYRDYFTKDLLAQIELLGKVNTDWAQHELLISAETGKLTSDQYQLRCDATYSGARHCQNQLNVYHPNYGIYLPNMGLQTNTRETQNYAALNLQDQMFLNEHWSVLIGTRFDHIKQSLDNYKNNVSTDKTFFQSSPRLGLNYKLNDQFSVYSNYGRSFAMNSGSDVHGQTFQPEQGESYELGSKYHLNDQTLLSVALFHMKKRNILSTDPTDANYQYAAGEAKSQGLELDIQSQINQKLAVMANYTYTDAKITRDTQIPIGSALNNIPRNSGAIGLNYLLFDDTIRKMGIGGHIHYVGKRNGTQSTGFELPDYTLVNLNAYYEPSSQLRYQVNINNLFNAQYNLESYSEMWIQPGEPLNASVSLQWKF